MQKVMAYRDSLYFLLSPNSVESRALCDQTILDLHIELYARTLPFSGKILVYKHPCALHLVLCYSIISSAGVNICRALEHKNLVHFIGACLEVPYVCIATEYCPKGSLSDVLQNDDIPLNWGFRFVAT